MTAPPLGSLTNRLSSAEAIESVTHLLVYGIPEEPSPVGWTTRFLRIPGASVKCWPLALVSWAKRKLQFVPQRFARLFFQAIRVPSTISALLDALRFCLSQEPIDGGVLAIPQR